MKLTFAVLLCYCLSLASSDDCSSPVVNVYGSCSGGGGINGASGGGSNTNGGECSEISSKLDAMSSQLSNIESKLNNSNSYGLTFTDWEVVFRANAGNGGQNLLELWEGITSLNDGIPEAKKVDGSFEETYKSSLVEQWGILDIKKVKFTFYNDGEEVMTLIFNGIGSNKMNWFDKDRLLQTPYPDMLTSTFNHFEIGPVIGPCPICRMWYISKNHGGCNVDKGWVAVTSHNACVWDRIFGEAPQFVYSSRGGANVWESDSPSSASVMAISINTRA
ncbi:uncharacterized protein [Antedon mediterranea]|uniref:uncharacterized protein n=1 Tax=Antedon mediterranea TaxID=105859 RepID=UPI003AF778EC